MDLAAGRKSSRRWVLTALLAIVMALLLAPGLQKARAQNDAAGEADAAQATPSKGSTNLFTHIIVSAGPFFGPLLLIISLGLVALIVILAMDLRLAIAIPPDFVEEFTDTVNKRKFKEAFDLARGDNSYLARVLAAGMGRLQYGLDDAREVVFNTVDSIRASKDQFITYLATIGTLGPMIGLVGTVYGMILAFMELNTGKTPDAGRLAGAISHALVLTLLGVALSVPAIFCHAFFRNRLIRISMDTSNIADDLLTQMFHNSRRPGSGPAAAPGASVPTAKPAPQGAV